MNRAMNCKLGLSRQLRFASSWQLIEGCYAHIIDSPMDLTTHDSKVANVRASLPTPRCRRRSPQLSFWYTMTAFTLKHK